MPNGVPYEVYVVATKRADGTLPNEVKIYDERVFFSREDAAEAIEDFQPYMRDSFDIFTANLEITAVSSDAPFVMPSDDSDEAEAEDESGQTPETNARNVKYTACKDVVVEWCTNNRSELETLAEVSLTDDEFAKVCTAESWSTWSERDDELDPQYDYDSVNGGFLFTCDTVEFVNAFVDVDDNGDASLVKVEREG